MYVSAIKAVIFDMGGVLLRTEDAAPRLALASRYGLSREALEQLVFASETSVAAERGELSEDEHFRRISKQLGIDEEAIPAFYQTFWQGDRMDVKLVDFIRSLRQQYKTALLSNAWDGTRAAVKAIYDFSDAFDVLIFSAEVGMRKPDPAIYRYIVEQLGVRPDEALFVDDVAQNVEGARQAGLRAVQFRDRGQAQRDVLAELGR
ncbi:MAG TPA: HAD family phosphatase [Anaerolineaceae bacterium]|nr:HAD family phosphatase [Anaerolineaceae bacterium]